MTWDKGMKKNAVGRKETTGERLIEIAKIQSTEASNKIEGIVTTDRVLPIHKEYRWFPERKVFGLKQRE